MSQILVVFSSAATAEFPVAGVPAAARVVRALARLQAGGSPAGCTIATNHEWMPSAELHEECRRLAPRLPVAFTRLDVVPARADVLVVAGELFLGALARSRADDRGSVLIALSETRIVGRRGALLGGRREQLCLAVLRRASRHFVASTGKSGDGVVSRLFNRPISQSISNLLLRKIPNIRPYHASMGTATLGFAMILSLVLGGQAGLIGGAILFQAASIFDGVDGEIARATFRTSDWGAMLDSLIDAATNIAFIAGVSANLFLAGDVTAAFAGGLGLVMLSSGLFLIGRRSRANGEPINFDIVKAHLRTSRLSSPIAESLIMLTMRDFFAAAGAVLILLGWTHWALIAFAIVAAGWLLVSVIMLLRTQRRKPLAWLSRVEMMR